MLRKLTFVSASAALVSQTSALLVARRDCPPVADVVKAMNAAPDNATVQLTGCRYLSFCIRTNSKELQDAAAAAGSIEASIAALRGFPDNIDVQDACIGATARPILFNRENGLRAGSLGGLNLTLKAYARWMDKPRITGHGGDVGCYLDYCDENRAILRELGGVQLLIQNIRNNFHGKYSDWDYNPVKNSLFGLSSGTWRNADIAHKEGFVDLALQLLTEHTSEDKIAEETLQAVKAMMYASDEYRQEFSEKGMAARLAKVLKENPNDRGAVSLACETVRFMVGPAILGDPRGEVVVKNLNAEAQVRAAREGLLDQLMATVTSGAALHHKEHSMFNFDVDSSYLAEADCIEGLGVMAFANENNTRTMLQGGLTDAMIAKLRQSKLNLRTKMAACNILRALTFNAELNSTATSLVKEPLRGCDLH